MAKPPEESMKNDFGKPLYKILSLLLGMILMSACAMKIGDFEVQIGDPEMLEVGELQREVETVPAEGVERVDVEVRMNAGTLALTGGSEALMEAEFTYNVDEWQPAVSFEQEAGIGTLTVRQPLKGTIQAADARNEWSLRFNENIPMRMSVSLGAGEVDIDLRGLNLEDLDIELGAGQVTIDLSGDWDQDFSVNLKRGVGEASVLLPADVGVRVNVASGLGSVVSLGLSRQGEYYVNEAYGDSEVTIEIEILGAIGSIELEVIE
ncbi:MAG: hypothetical protein A2Z14_12070 [Chloroflexi bacterium RBG_16_48_8]|nr:MAG: hypothetical protein A2Z14_12070 [Chloroflexi bacterium RBG_16_48_8]